MIQNSVARGLTAALAITVVAGLGCGIARPGDEPPVDDPSSPDGCRSSIESSGLLCSSCPGDGPGAAPECMAAQCSVSDRCLRCVDPKGRVGRDCSIDYEVLHTGSLTVSPGDSYNLAACSFMWGVASASGTTCHYPGTQSCREDRGSHCLSCTYPDGSGSGICNDGSEPLPDPMMGRPVDLPAPGSCISDLGKDGVVSCTTCTRDDLSVSRSCHYPGIIACQVESVDDGEGDCLARCSVDGGADVRLCNSPRGPRLVESPPL